MKAVILAGGEGKRLRPLTDNIPKPLVALCGKPVLEHLFEWLETNHINSCIIALGHHGEQIREYCRSHPRPLLQIEYSQEPTPIGTAGSVRLALKENCPALVISGDALCNYELMEAIQKHEERQAAVTILTTKSDDPREYGTVLTDANGRITGFVEKPSFSQVVDETINTGIYLLSAQAVEKLPQRGDFAKDFFPALLQDNMAMYADSVTGYWRDIGSPDAFRQAGRDLLAGLIGKMTMGKPPKGNYLLRPPVWVGENTQIGDGSIIGPWTVLESGCSVGVQAQVTDSMIASDVQIESAAFVDESILCNAAHIGSEAHLSGCIVGEDAYIGDGSRIFPAVCIAQNETVSKGSFVTQTVQSAVTFDDLGITGLPGCELTPEFSLALGCAIGSLPGKYVAVGWDGDNACAALADALKVGIRSAGMTILDFGCVFSALFRFGVNYSGAAIGVHFSGRDRTTIALAGIGGLSLDRQTERAIEQRMRQRDFVRTNHFGILRNMRGFSAYYGTQLLSCAPGGLDGSFAWVSCANPGIKALLTQALRNLGCCIDPKGILLEISNDGTHLTMRHGDTTLDELQTVAAYGQTRFRLGEDLAVENNFPRAIDTFAAKWGCNVQRYFLCPANDSDAIARGLAAHQCSYDGLRLGITILAELHDREISLHTLLSEIPQFSTKQAEIALSLSPGRVLACLDGDSTGEGILVKHPGKGIVLVRSRKDGQALRLFAEAASSEMAQELCADLCCRIRSHLSKEGLMQNAEE